MSLIRLAHDRWINLDAVQNVLPHGEQSSLRLLMAGGDIILAGEQAQLLRHALNAQQPAPKVDPAKIAAHRRWQIRAQECAADVEALARQAAGCDPERLPVLLLQLREALAELDLARSALPPTKGD